MQSLTYVPTEGDIMTEYTYKIEQTESNTVAGEPTWAVVEYVDGQARGADCHWVRERYAYRAAELYTRRPELHGRGSQALREAGLVFDPDAPDMDARYSHRDTWNRTHTDSARTLHRQTNGWTSFYDAQTDTFDVHGPEGTRRTYRRVS